MNSQTEFSVKGSLIRAAVVEITCFAFQLLFLYAAVSKLLDYENSKLQLGQSPLLNSWAGLVAWLIPVIEIMLAILLCLRPVRLFAMYWSFVLMVMFTAYIVIILHFSEYIPCSCGGVLSAMSWDQHLIFNIAFIALAVAGILCHEDLH